MNVLYDFLKTCLKMLIAMIEILGATIQDVNVDFFAFGVIITFLLCSGIKMGIVEFLSGENYIWKLEGEIYYVLINGEWVQMPPALEPGDPLPPANAPPNVI